MEKKEELSKSKGFHTGCAPVCIEPRVCVLVGSYVSYLTSVSGFDFEEMCSLGGEYSL